MMKIHEHLVKVCSPLDPLSKSMTQAQLWRWLEWFVRHPHDFTEAMEASHVEESLDEQGRSVLKRELDFGSMKVNDKVIIEVGRCIRTEVAANEHWAAGAFTITVVQPKENGSVFLKFTYEEDRDEPMGDDMISNLRRKAYEQKDRDMVDLIVQKVLEEDASVN
ncbi:MAG: DUF1857 family protein [Burkholderiaceae bacterium]|jgi:hypothetical protein|nr:DUF1857 family protein [Burkholderiaceae bacterium]